MNEQIRAEYEKEFPVPTQTIWSDTYAGYINCAPCPNFAAAVHQEGWVRWQAAHARYAGSDSEPVAYAAFADNGNIRIWCADPVQAETLKAEYGHDLKALYTSPPAQPKVPEGWNFERLPESGAYKNGIRVDAPNDCHAMLIRQDHLPDHDMRAIFYDLCNTMLLAQENTSPATAVSESQLLALLSRLLSEAIDDVYLENDPDGLIAETKAMLTQAKDL